MPYRSDESTPLSAAQARKMLRQAAQAAQTGEAGRALRLLAESGFLDGLVRRLRGAYSDLDDFGAEELIAEGVNLLYVRIATADKPPLKAPDAYLLKSIFGLAKDQADRQREEREAAFEHEKLAHGHDGDAPSRDMLRNEAVRVARSLLPRLGQENAQRVMDMVLDAVEEREPVSPTEIGDALDLLPNTVSKLIERGITRLGRVADEEGLVMRVDYALAIEEEFELSAAERELENEGTEGEK